LKTQLHLLENKFQGVRLKKEQMGGFASKVELARCSESAAPFANLTPEEIQTLWEAAKESLLKTPTECAGFGMNQKFFKQLLSVLPDKWTVSQLDACFGCFDSNKVRSRR
jgi:hypothetical protein